MAQVTFRANRAALQRLLKGREGPVALHIANKGREAEGAARRLVPVVSGDLKASIDSQMIQVSGGDWSFEISSDLPYATWIHDGKRYDPRSGRVIFVRVGPRPFLLEALRVVGLPLSRRQ